MSDFTNDGVSGYQVRNNGHYVGRGLETLDEAKSLAQVERDLCSHCTIDIINLEDLSTVFVLSVPQPEQGDTNEDDEDIVTDEEESVE